MSYKNCSTFPLLDMACAVDCSESSPEQTTVKVFITSYTDEFFAERDFIRKEVTHFLISCAHLLAHVVYCINEKVKDYYFCEQEVFASTCQAQTNLH